MARPIHNGIGANDRAVSGARISESVSSRSWRLYRRAGFSVRVRGEELRVFDRTHLLCARPIIRGVRRIHRAPVGALIVGSRRDAYPSLCAKVLNAIMQYKDTIGNSMARVLCSAHTTPSSPDQIFFRRERKLITESLRSCLDLNPDS